MSENEEQKIITEIIQNGTRNKSLVQLKRGYTNKNRAEDRETKKATGITLTLKEIK